MKKLFSYLAIAGFILFAMSCSSDEETPSGTSSRVNFYLVDAPGSYDEVWIEVLALRVKVDVDDDDDRDDDLDDDDESKWVEIGYEKGQLINLLDLTGGKSELLGTEDLPKGEIEKIRLVLGSNNYVIKDGERFDLKTPSAQQSGLKVKIDEDIEGGQFYDLVIDFDVAKSIVEAGNSGQLILKPVLRAYIEKASTGIKGQILPADAQNILVTLYEDDEDDDDEVINTYVDKNGNFKITGLDDDTYTLKITPNELYKGLVIENIEIEDGEIVTLDPIVLTLK